MYEISSEHRENCYKQVVRQTVHSEGEFRICGEWQQTPVQSTVSRLSHKSFHIHGHTPYVNVEQNISANSSETVYVCDQRRLLARACTRKQMNLAELLRKHAAGGSMYALVIQGTHLYKGRMFFDNNIYVSRLMRKLKRLSRKLKLGLMSVYLDGRSYCQPYPDLFTLSGTHFQIAGTFQAKKIFDCIFSIFFLYEF